jgi:carbon storage regulator
MLVLSRKPFERIYIGPDVCITVLDIQPGKVRLGIEAPRDVDIHREEVLPADHPARGSKPLPEVG